MKVNYEQIKSGIIGFIVGDALGVPIEFVSRKFLARNKVTDMRGFGSHNVPKGSWSDDTSMTLATMQAIVQNNGIINYDSIMNNFLNWVKKAEFTPNGYVFDIGRTVSKALRRYRKSKDFRISGINNHYSNGNGSLMRFLPIIYYAYYNNIKDNELYLLVKRASSLTHKHEISILGCYIYTLFFMSLLDGKDKKDAYEDIKKNNYSLYFRLEILAHYDRILNYNINEINQDKIMSSGYIVDTLEAVLWCFLNCTDYSKTLIEAVNLGKDTDTIGALTGGLCGIYYGYNDIPAIWINNLARKDYLFDMCNDFWDVLNNLEKYEKNER